MLYPNQVIAQQFSGNHLQDLKKQLSGCCNQSQGTSNYPNQINGSVKKQQIFQEKEPTNKFSHNNLHKILIVGELKTGKSSLIKMIHMYESLLEESQMKLNLDEEIQKNEKIDCNCEVLSNVEKNQSNKQTSVTKNFQADILFRNAQLKIQKDYENPQGAQTSFKKENALRSNSDSDILQNKENQQFEHNKIFEKKSSCIGVKPFIVEKELEQNKDKDFFNNNEFQQQVINIINQPVNKSIRRRRISSGTPTIISEKKMLNYNKIQSSIDNNFGPKSVLDFQNKQKSSNLLSTLNYENIFMENKQNNNYCQQKNLNNGFYKNQQLYHYPQSQYNAETQNDKNELGKFSHNVQSEKQKLMIKNQYNKNSDFSLKIMYMEDQKLRIQLWDQGKYRDPETTFQPLYIRNVSACIIVANTSNPQSIERAYLWKQQFDQTTKLKDEPPLPCTLFINHDLPEQTEINKSVQILQNEIDKFQDQNNINQNDVLIKESLECRRCKKQTTPITSTTSQLSNFNQDKRFINNRTQNFQHQLKPQVNGKIDIQDQKEFISKIRWDKQQEYEKLAKLEKNSYFGIYHVSVNQPESVKLSFENFIWRVLDEQLFTQRTYSVSSKFFDEFTIKGLQSQTNTLYLRENIRQISQYSPNQNEDFYYLKSETSFFQDYNDDNQPLENQKISNQIKNDENKLYFNENSFKLQNLSDRRNHKMIRARKKKNCC